MEDKDQPTSFVIDLKDIPNGERKPVEVCSFTDAIEEWREKSARSTLLIH